MIVTVILNKIKSFIFIFVNIFRRALCCFRRRRRSSCESVPLTHVVSEKEEVPGFQNWEDNWGENHENVKEKTVQDHIEMYRKQAQILSKGKEEPPEEQLDFFEDMTPNITRQTKVLINTDTGGVSRHQNRLNFVEDSITAVPTSELREWEDSSGWEGDSLDSDAQKVLREKKRQERERRVWEQHQKRLEKSSRVLGSKLSA